MARTCAICRNDDNDIVAAALACSKATDAADNMLGTAMNAYHNAVNRQTAVEGLTGGAAPQFATAARRHAAELSRQAQQRPQQQRPRPPKPHDTRCGTMAASSHDESAAQEEGHEEGCHHECTDADIAQESDD